MPLRTLDYNAHPNRDEIARFIELAAISNRQLPLWNELIKDPTPKDRGRVFLKLGISWKLEKGKREVDLFCNLGKYEVPYVKRNIGDQQDANDFWRDLMAYVDNEWPKVLAAHARLKTVRREMNAVMLAAKKEFDEVLKSTIHG